MKTSKRILGIALAIIMIFNVFAVGVFAAFPDDAGVKLIITADKATYAPGEEITFTVATQVDPVLTNMQVGGQYDLAFNSTGLDFISTKFGINTLSDHGFVSYIDDCNAANSGFGETEAPDIDASLKAEGVDRAFRINVIDFGNVTFDATSAVNLFSFKMKVKDDAVPGTYVIGFNKVGYDEYSGYINDGNGLGGLYGNCGSDYGLSQEYVYDCGKAVITVATPASKIIFHEDAMYNEAGTTEETAMLGFIGNFNKDDIGGFEFVAEGDTKLANVSAVGVTLEIVGLDSITRTSQTIHPTATEGVYNFRAVLDSLNLEQYGDAEMKITYFITFDNAGVEDTQYSDTETTTANAIIAGTF